MPKKFRPWIRHVWKKCPVSSILIYLTYLSNLLFDKFIIDIFETPRINFSFVRMLPQNLFRPVRHVCGPSAEIHRGMVEQPNLLNRFAIFWPIT